MTSDQRSGALKAIREMKGRSIFIDQKVLCAVDVMDRSSINSRERDRGVRRRRKP